MIIIIIIVISIIVSTTIIGVVIISIIVILIIIIILRVGMNSIVIIIIANPTRRAKWPKSSATSQGDALGTMPGFRTWAAANQQYPGCNHYLIANDVQQHPWCNRFSHRERCTCEPSKGATPSSRNDRPGQNQDTISLKTSTSWPAKKARADPGRPAGRSQVGEACWSWSLLTPAPGVAWRGVLCCLHWCRCWLVLLSRRFRPSFRDPSGK